MQKLLERELQLLLQLFEDVFQESIGLPPSREYNNQIILKEGAQLVNLRPYGNNSMYKDIIEKIVQEMLDVGLITLVLGLLDFSKPFIIETDVSEEGISVVIMQEG